VCARRHNAAAFHRFHFHLFRNTIPFYAVRVNDTPCMLHCRTTSVRHCAFHCSRYGVLILSNSFPLSLPVGSFTVLAQAGHRRSGIAVGNNKRQLSDKMRTAALSRRVNTASVTSRTVPTSVLPSVYPMMFRSMRPEASSSRRRTRTGLWVTGKVSHRL
jgi:hypothetical protein